MGPQSLYIYLLNLATYPKLLSKEEIAEDNIVKCSFVDLYLQLMNGMTNLFLFTYLFQ